MRQRRSLLEWLTRLHITRDSILFGTGLMGIFYETVFQKIDRPSLLVLFSAMIGLPAFLSADSRRRGSDDEVEEIKPKKRAAPKKRLPPAEGD